MAQSRIIHLDREEHRLHIPFSSEPVRLTSDFESEVISLARYMESVARLQKMQRGLPELLYVLSGFPAR